MSHAFTHLLTALRYRLRRPQAGRPGIAPDDDNFRRMSFTFAVIALSARVACADGELTRARYITFRESFPLEGDECGKIRSLFTLACADATPVAHYLTQLRHAFPHSGALFSSLLERLFSIAAADGHVSHESDQLLASISHGLGVDTMEYVTLRQRCLRGIAAHDVLGVKRRAGAAALKRRYRELMQRYHPDRFAGKTVSPEVAMLLQLKASEINDAYHALSKQAA